MLSGLWALDGLGGTAEAVHMDLSNLTSVRLAAKDVIRRSRNKLHLLVCSAGVMPSPLGASYSLTTDGIELVFGVNHLGHFALAEALRPAYALSRVMEPGRTCGAMLLRLIGWGSHH